MKSLVPVVNAPLAEHLVNGRGEVMVLVPPLRATPVAWRGVGDAGGGAFGLGFSAGQAAYFRLPPTSLALAARQARMLVVEMGERGPVKDTWVGYVPA